jgi:integrase
MLNYRINPPLATTFHSSTYKYWSLYLENHLFLQTVPKQCQMFQVSDIILRDKNGDMTRPWYIEFSWKEDGVVTRKRIKADINRIKDKKQRYAEAKLIMNELQAAVNIAVFQKLDPSFNQVEKVEIIPIVESNHIKILTSVLEKTKNTINKRSLHTYEYSLRLFFEFLSTNKIYEAHKKHIELYIQYLKEKKRAQKSIYGNIMVVRNLYNKAIAYDLLTINPCAGIKVPNKTTGEKSIPWTDEEFQKLMDYTADKLNLKVYWGLIYYCAIRPNEISHLQRKHIDILDKKILIEASFSKVKKSQKIAIPRQFAADLKLYISAMTDLDYLFNSKLTIGPKKCDPNKYAGQWAQQIKKKLEIYKDAYSLKHTSAVHMVKAGISKTKIQHHFRHSSVSMTEIYLKSIDGCVFNEMSDEFPDFN